MLQKREEEIKVTVQSNDEEIQEHERFLNYNRDHEFRRQSNELNKSEKQVEPASQESKTVTDMMQQAYS